MAKPLKKSPLKRPLDVVREKLNHVSMKWRPTQWLDTKLKDLNEVLGHKVRGLFYGQIIEILGWESMGKTAITLSLAALAQLDEAHVIWVGIENSFPADWALKRGLAPCPLCKATGLLSPTLLCPDCNSAGAFDAEDGSMIPGPTCGLDTTKLTLILPYVGRFQYKGKDGKMHQEKEARLSNAQEICAEAMEVMKMFERSIFVIDSLAALQTESEADDGIENATMKTSMSLPMFLGRLMKSLAGLSQVHTSIVVLINQLREGPNAGEKSVGGNAPKFYAHSRVKLRRVKGGRIMDKGKKIGITGVMRNMKNKAGGAEGMEIGYQIYDTGPLKFIKAMDAKKNEDWS